MAGATGFVAVAHANAILSNKNARIVMAYGRNVNLLKERCRKWGIKKYSTDYYDLLREEEVEVIDILTPPFLHKEMAVAAAESGKHIIVEKPMCRSVKEANEMIRAAKKNGVRLMVAESYVFTTTHMKARELIDDGRIGKPMQIRMSKGVWLRREQIKRRQKISFKKETHWRLDPEKSGGGEYPWFMDHAVHFFALARYLMNDITIKKIFSLSRPLLGKQRDIPVVVWEYDTRGRYGLWNRVDESISAYDHLGFRTIVNGTEGVLEVLGEGGGVALSGYKHPPLILHTRGETSMFQIDEGLDRIWISEVNYYDQAHKNELNHFIRCLIENKKPRYTGEDAKTDVQYTLAAIKSAIECKPINPESIPEDWTAYKSLQHSP